MKYVLAADQQNAVTLIGGGLLCAEFDPETGACGGVIGEAESARFEAKPQWTDFGADVDNMPSGVAALQRLTGVSVRLTGSFRGLMADRACRLTGGNAGPVPRGGQWTGSVDLWFVWDCGAEAGGWAAVKIKNALSDGLTVETAYQDTGLCRFELRGCRDLRDPDRWPYELYLRGE